MYSEKYEKAMQILVENEKKKAQEENVDKKGKGEETKK